MEAADKLRAPNRGIASAWARQCLRFSIDPTICASAASAMPHFVPVHPRFAQCPWITHGGCDERRNGANLRNPRSKMVTDRDGPVTVVVAVED